MKKYFRRENVIIVLSVIFSGIVFLCNNFNENQKKYFDDFKNEINKKSLSTQLLYNSKIITQFTNDSLQNIQKRIREYGIFMIGARKFPNEPNLEKSIELKRSVFDDIARLSKFKDLPSSKETPNQYAFYMEYLQCEKDLVNIFHDFSLSAESKSTNSKKMYGNMEKKFIELESINKKIISTNSLFKSTFFEKKANSENTSKQFIIEMDQRKESLQNYLYLIFLLGIAWITICALAVKYKSFE
jgi:hypothetical protein